MMIPMKKLLPLLTVLMLTVSVTSCLDWDNEEELTYLTWATVTSNEKAPTLRADNGMILEALNNVLTDTTFYEIGDRVYLQDTYGDTSQANGTHYPIYLSNYMKMVTKSYVTVANDTDDVYLSKPFSRVNSAILSGGYLNCIIHTFASYATLNTVELVRYKVEEQNLPTDTLPVILMTLKHNATSVDYNYVQMRGLSYSLDSLATEFPQAKTFKLRLSWTDDSKFNTFDLLYSPSSNTP
jgi:hypothetical protein